MRGIYFPKAILLALVAALLASCSPFASKKPPIILILLESFSEQDFLCSDSKRVEDLFELQGVCEEFIRYTHVYAPSTLTQTNVSSLFTGLPVNKHRVEHNGAQAISSRVQTIGENAVNMKMRTAFFSGGVPLLRKFGVSQGVENFFDPFAMKTPQFFLPFNKTVEIALDWLDQEVGQKSFFLTLYAPDLMYKDEVTIDGLDNERPLDRGSALQEIYETFNDLVGELKKRKRWKNSHVVVAGLSGPQHSLKPFNPLSSQYLHVPLQIKVSERVKSNLSELTSEMVSFSKLGRWLDKMILHKPSQGDLIFSPEPEDRFLPQQNGWAQWRNLSNWVTKGLRRRQYLFSYNPKLVAFDTFYDKKEYEPLVEEEAKRLASKFDVSKQMKLFFPKSCFDSAHSSCETKQTNQKKIRQLSQLVRWTDSQWESESPVDKFQDRMQEANKKKDSIALNWLAYRALYEKRWVDLFELGNKVKVDAWKLVSQLNLRENLPGKPKDCLKYFVVERKNISEFYQHCQDSGLRRVVEGLMLLKQKKRPSENFWAQVDTIKRRRRAKNLNLKMLLINDIKGSFDFEPTLSELYFFLPENLAFLDLIDVDKS